MRGSFTSFPTGRRAPGYLKSAGPQVQQCPAWHLPFLLVILECVGKLCVCGGEWCSKHAPSSANVTAVLLQILSFLRGKFSSFEYPYADHCASFIK